MGEESESTLQPKGKRRGAGLPWALAEEFEAEIKTELRTKGNLGMDAQAMLTHDARNLLTALELYCDLLDEPGVLSRPFRHYAEELRLVTGASRRLIDRISACGHSESGVGSAVGAALANVPSTSAILASRWPRMEGLIAEAKESEVPVSLGNRHSGFKPGQPIVSLAHELDANLSLLSALAGPGISVAVSRDGGQVPIQMNSDDLTRVLLNLVKNAAEAMPSGGHIQIHLEQLDDSVYLSVADTGDGIDEDALEAVFVSGVSTHRLHDAKGEANGTLWESEHRGLGLAIVQSLTTQAGGMVWASNRTGFSETELLSKQTELWGGAGGRTGTVISMMFPVVTTLDSE